MREIRTSGLMSGEGKRSDWQKPQATAPFLDSTIGFNVPDNPLFISLLRVYTPNPDYDIAHMLHDVKSPMFP